MHALTDAAIRRLVDRFYAKVRLDPDLGPIFDRALDGRWEPHLAIMTDFWSSVMLTSGRYKGNPMVTHAKVEGIAAELFPRWLELFSETAAEEFEPDIAGLFDVKAARIADSLKRGLFYQPEYDQAGVL
jgi:hemoglobin